MPLDVGRVSHLLEQMHRSEDDAGDPIDEGMVLVTDGARGFTWESFGTGGSDADIVHVNEGIVGGPGPTVEADLAELFEAVDWAVDTVGSLSADGDPQTVTDDSFHNTFPGLARLDARRVLTVYRKGTNHASGGNIVGKIGALADDHESVASWGTEFTIRDDATLDLRCEDGVSIIDGRLVIAFRTYDGADNHDPSILICDDLPTDFTEASTWGSPIALPDPGGTVQEYTQGHVHKHSDGTYLLGGGFDSGGTHTVGVFRWTGTLEDAATASFVTVYSGAGDYSEITLGILPDGTVRALGRSDTNDDFDTKTSADSGATWSSNANAFDGHGNPMWRILKSTLSLSVYRISPNGDTAWRSSSDFGATWSGETTLDTTGTRNAYASLVQLTPTKILCIYGVEYSSDGSTGGGDLFTQIFTDTSTFVPNIQGTSLSDDTPLIEDGDGDPGVSTEASRSDHVHPEFSSGGGGIGEILISDTPSTPLVFADLIQNEAQNDLVYADP